jgi:transcriptional regulator with XRE-family HTH domain
MRRERRPASVELGLRVRELRKAQNMAQDDLAEKAGVHRTQIGFIEQGTRDLRLSTLQKVAFALGVDASELIAGLPGP